jgi:hypothetical protein
MVTNNMIDLRSPPRAGRLAATAILLALMLCPRPIAAIADELQRSCPVPGTRMVVSDGAILTFGSSDGLTCNIEDDAGENFARYGLVWENNNRITYEEGKATIAKLWPLAVGKTVHFDTHSEGATVHHRFTVTGRENITVPAGTFAVYVVVNDEISELNSTTVAYHVIWTHYISPKLGYIVKNDYKYYQGKPEALVQEKEFEATSITSPP